MRNVSLRIPQTGKKKETGAMARRNSIKASYDMEEAPELECEGD